MNVSKPQSVGLDHERVEEHRGRRKLGIVLWILAGVVLGLTVSLFPTPWAARGLEMDIAQARYDGSLERNVPIFDVKTQGEATVVLDQAVGSVQRGGIVYFRLLAYNSNDPEVPVRVTKVTATAGGENIVPVTLGTQDGGAAKWVGFELPADVPARVDFHLVVNVGTIPYQDETRQNLGTVEFDVLGFPARDL